MQIRREPPLDLTYCTNIHPAQGWQDVHANIRRYAPLLKEKLSPAAPFGLGLRLSAREASELKEPGRLDDFASFLADHGLYVALINGFPYGPFHGAAVKSRVYAPDWRDRARVEYTLDLVEILRRLLPEGMDGSVSTVPLSFKTWMQGATEEDWRAIVGNVIAVAERCVRIRREEGKWIHLDIEPEPACSIENSHESVEFFERRLLPAGRAALASAFGLPMEEAARDLLDHVQLCFDCCHFAVEYEDPLAALERIRSAGIQIGRIQLSSALRASFPGDAGGFRDTGSKLQPFVESTYLHQVGAKQGGRFRVFTDLDVALSENGAPESQEWCIHFHVPLFTGAYEGFSGTQSDTAAVVRAASKLGITTHLEIETYTWDVLPAGLKVDLAASIQREYEWVLAQIPKAAVAGPA